MEFTERSNKLFDGWFSILEIISLLNLLGVSVLKFGDSCSDGVDGGPDGGSRGCGSLMSLVGSFFGTHGFCTTLVSENQSFIGKLTENSSVC